jgi:hypothetical protein
MTLPASATCMNRHRAKSASIDGNDCHAPL